MALRRAILMKADPVMSLHAHRLFSGRACSCRKEPCYVHVRWHYGCLVSCSLGTQPRQSFTGRFSTEATFDDTGSGTLERPYYRRNRTKFSPEQIEELEATFEKNQYPDVLTREDLGRRLNIGESRVQVKRPSREFKQSHLPSNFQAFELLEARRQLIRMPYFKAKPLGRFSWRKVQSLDTSINLDRFKYLDWISRGREF